MSVGMTAPQSGAGGDEDYGLVRRTLRGEADAFEALFVKYRQRLFSVAFRIVRHEDAALDVVQETFIKAYENLAGLRQETRVFPWLRRIAVNLSIDKVRQRKRIAERSLEEELAEGGEEAGMVLAPPSEEPEPSVLAQDEEFAKALWTALGELSENHRTVFVLHAVEKMTYREVAEAVGCNLGTVMSRLHYARKKLQDLLRPHLVNCAERGRGFG